MVVQWLIGIRLIRDDTGVMFFFFFSAN